MDLVILVPVLGRPEFVEPLLRSVQSSNDDARVLFICDADDKTEIAAVRKFGGEGFIHSGSYPQKINVALKRTDEQLVFLGADDLRFRPGWLTAARAKLDEAEVVGINDLIPRTRDHQTHFLVTRDYCDRGQIDGAPGLLHEGYAHCCTDDELIAVAKHRGTYAYASDSHVKHLHPMIGEPSDETYRKGMASLRQDRWRFNRRQKLWMPPS